MDKMTKEIFDLIEDNDEIKIAVVAKALEISVKQLNNYKNGTRALTFHSLVKLVQIVSPQDAHERISHWCANFATTDTISNAFAYAAAKRDLKLLAELVDKHRNSDGKIEQCVRVYEFILRFMSRNVDKYNMVKEIDGVKNIKDTSLTLLLDIYRLIAKFHSQDFRVIPSIAEELLIRIHALHPKKQGFIRECYVHLVAEIYAITNLHHNNLEVARHFARILLHGAVNYRSMADAYYVLAMTYLRENEAKAYEYMTQSYEFSRKTGDANIERNGLYNLHFIQLLRGEKLPAVADPALIYFEKFRKGEVSYAEAREEIGKGDDLDLIKYFESISGDVEKMYEGFHEFHADGNMYYASILVQEILKAGEDSGFVRSLSRMCLSKKTNLKGDDLFEEKFIRSFNSNYSSSDYHCA